MWNSDFMLLPASSGENPGLGAQRIRTFKTEIQDVVNKEHYLGTSGDSLTYQKAHREGSARASVDDYSGGYPSVNPFGDAWSAVDAGRLYIDTSSGVNIAPLWNLTFSLMGKI